MESPIKFKFEYLMKHYTDFDLKIYYSFKEQKPNSQKFDKKFENRPEHFLIFSKDLTGE